ncbi:MAG: hypothetical protein NVSMB14_17920 [Isosphaeraceae bacterium]
MFGMKTKPFSDQIRDAVAASGLSRYSICKSIGLPESSMSRFMTGKSGLALETIDRLAELLGLTVASATNAKPKGRG